MAERYEGYCVRCRAKREMQEAYVTETRNGRRMVKGKCPECGTTINKFLPSSRG